MRIALLLGALVMTAGCTAEGDGAATGGSYVLRGPTAAQEVVWAEPSPVLRLQVHHAPGRELLSRTIDAMLQTLREETAKREVVLDEPAAIPGHASSPERRWDGPALDALERRLRPAEVPGEVTLRVLVVDGQSPDGRRGAQAGRVLFLFPDEIRDVLEGVELDERTGRYADAERYVAVHEVGHAMGLVDCGAPMLTPRADPAGGCHSTEQESPMRVDGDLLESAIGFAGEGRWAPWRFTEADRRDLAALRASAP